MISDTTAGSYGLAKKSQAPSATARRALALSCCPVTTMTLVSGASSRMFSSVRKPSVDAARFRRQAEVERHHGGFEPAHLRDRFFPVRRDRDVLGVERPLHLRLQRGVVLDHQQRSGRASALMRTAPSV